MNKEEFDKLLELYEQGLTSSEEESFLVKNLSHSKSETNLWFSYLKYKKKSAPKNLENRIWSSIQEQEKIKSRFRLKVFSIAASIVLLISVLLIKPEKHGKMSDEEKAAVLQEALSMVKNTQKAIPLSNIIYEDETIIIYTEQ